jgi:hypothetical protein
VTKSRRDPAELAALIEQGVAKGLDLVDAFRSATGKGPRGANRALELEHRKALAANRTAVRKHTSRVQGLRTEMTGGAVVAGAGGAAGLIDVVTSATGGSFPGPAWMWLGSAAVGLFVSVRARRQLRHVGPPPIVIDPVAPPPVLPRGAVGQAEVARFSSVRVQVVNITPQLDRLYPGSGQELRRADLEAAGPLTALCERLLVLDQMQRELPGTSAAASAAKSAQLVRARLARGCEKYDELLAAAARLLAAPDYTRSTEAILGPAVDAMLAYAHGLQKAADL